MPSYTTEDDAAHLGNDGQFGPQVMETNAADADIIHNNLSTSSFNNAKQSQRQGGFTCSCPSHNANLK